MINSLLNKNKGHSYPINFCCLCRHLKTFERQSYREEVRQKDCSSVVLSLNGCSGQAGQALHPGLGGGAGHAGAPST